MARTKIRESTQTLKDFARSFPIPEDLSSDEGISVGASATSVPTMITNEIPSGLVNGSNTVFTTSQAYSAGTLLVYLNGLRQKRTVDYNETSSSTFTFVTAPLTGDLVLTDYNISTPLITDSSITFTTTGNIDDLDFANASLIRMNNASLATIRGLKAGRDGQRVTIVSIGAGQVDFAHQNVNSSANNRLINFVTSFSTPIAAGFGSAVYQYDNTTGRWRLIDHNQGDFIDISFSAGNFTGRDLMTWTVASGDVETLSYFIKDRFCTIQWAINTTTVGGTLNNWLQITFPFTARVTGQNLFRYLDAGASSAVGLASFQASVNNLKFLKLDFSNWSTATDNTYVFGQVGVDLT